MKKLVLGFGILFSVFFFSFNTCSAEETFPSGVNLPTSNLVIKYWRPATPAFSPDGLSLRCFGQKRASLYDCGLWGGDPCQFSVNLGTIKLDSDDPDKTMEKIVDNLGYKGCFQKAGHYEMYLDLCDAAKNCVNSSDTSIVFEIKPTSPDGKLSYFLHPCDSGTAIAADGTDASCTPELSILDRFSNPVSQLVESGDINFKGELSSASEDANLGISFIDGLRLKDGETWKKFPTPENPGVINNIYAAPSGSGVLASFGIGAMVPSLSKVGPAVDSENAAFLSEVTPLGVDITLDLPTINKDGTQNAENRVPVTTHAQLQFLPPFEIFPTIHGENGFVRVSTRDPEDPDGWLEEFPVQFSFPLFSFFENFDTEKLTGLRLGTILMGKNSMETVLADTDIVDLEQLQYGFSPVVDGENPDGDPDASGIQPFPVTHILSTTQGDATNITLSSGAILEYDIQDSAGGAPVTVKYPAGGVGFRSDFWDEEELKNGPKNAENLLGYHISTGEKVLGAHIVGGILGSESELVLNVHGETSSVIQLSSAADLRSKITENAYRLARGIDENFVLTGSPTVDLNLFDSTDVVVVQGDHSGTNVVKLSSDTMPTGNNTLIIFDANLVIEKSLKYANPTDSMGFILVNSNLSQGGGQADLTAQRNNGNIWIKNPLGNPVRRLVGTFFADGGLMSMPTDENDIMFGNADAANNDRFDQLLLTGALYTRNTLGGSDANNETGWFDPWGESATQENAKIYDLHEVRTYNYENLENDPNTLEDETYDHVDFCVRKSNSPDECIDDDASFVIELDRKVTNPTTVPPGFEIYSSISR